MGGAEQHAAHRLHLELALPPLHVQRDVLRREAEDLQPLDRDDAHRQLEDERRHAREVLPHLLAQRLDLLLEIAHLRLPLRLRRLLRELRRRAARARGGGRSELGEGGGGGGVGGGARVEPQEERVLHGLVQVLQQARVLLVQRGRLLRDGLRLLHLHVVEELVHLQRARLGDRGGDLVEAAVHLPRCNRDAGEMRGRCGGDAGGG